MKFEFEMIKTLRATNSKGELCVIGEGDELWLKLELNRMDLYNKEFFLKKYPDGWVKGRVAWLSSSGKKIHFGLSDDVCTYLDLSHRDILDVSDKDPKEVM